MKAKFYKGPWHNKSRWVSDDETMIVVAGSPKLDAFISDGADPFAPIAITKHIYNRSRHTHPDGSVFFVYEGKS